MKYPPYNKHDINVAEIWESEIALYAAGDEKDWEKMDELYDELLLFYMRARHKAIYDKRNPKQTENYNQHQRVYDTRINEKLLLSFFVRFGRVYDMTETCIVRLEKNNVPDFEKLFMLKLRHYADKLCEIESYLKYQLVLNFIRFS